MSYFPQNSYPDPCMHIGHLQSSESDGTMCDVIIQCIAQTVRESGLTTEEAIKQGLVQRDLKERLSAANTGAYNMTRVKRDTRVNEKYR